MKKNQQTDLPDVYISEKYYISHASFWYYNKI